MTLVKTLKNACVAYDKVYNTYAIYKDNGNGYDCIGNLKNNDVISINDYIEVFGDGVTFNVIKINKCNISIDNNDKLFITGNIQLLKD